MRRNTVFLLLTLLLFSGMFLLSGKENTQKKRRNLALHCAVFCHNGNNPEYAVDGKRGGFFFESRAIKENYLEIDLGSVKKVDGIRIFFWSGDLRYYQFYVLSSVDGKEWTMLFDGRDNRSRSSKEGVGKDFPVKNMRFVKVFVPYNSVNAASHVREVEIYGNE